MATNPRIPEQHDHATVHAEESRKRAFPVPLIILIVAAAILGTLIYYLPRTPKAEPEPTGAITPAQPTNGQVRLTDVSLASSPVGNQIYINAVLHNAGNTAINGVVVNVSFPGSNGKTAGTVQAPVFALTGESNSIQEPLVNHPIVPNGEQAVRIVVPNAPAGWNRQLPGVTVAEVTAVSAEGGAAKPSAHPGTTVTAEPPQAGAAATQPKR
jgi:hypothetical protein